MIPARTTVSQWHELVAAHTGRSYWERTFPPLAATSAELDTLWEGLHGRKRTRDGLVVTIWGNPIVEIEEWPEWLT